MPSSVCPHHRFCASLGRVAMPPQGERVHVQPTSLVGLGWVLRGVCEVFKGEMWVFALGKFNFKGENVDFCF